MTKADLLLAALIPAPVTKIAAEDAPNHLNNLVLLSTLPAQAQEADAALRNANFGTPFVGIQMDLQ